MSIRRLSSITAAVVVTAVLVHIAAGGAVAVTASPTITVSDATVEAGETATVAVELSSAPAGLSGYELSVSVADRSVGNITGASYGEAFELTDDPEFDSANGTVHLEAANLEGGPGPDATSIRLATVTLTGTQGGTTPLTVDIVQMDDDTGGRVDPTAEGGTIAVGETGDSGASDLGGLMKPDDTSPAGSGPTVPHILGAALAAVLILALLTYRYSP